MSAVNHVRAAFVRALDHIRSEQQRHYQREVSQPNGLVRQQDDADRQVQEQQARLQREQHQRQEQAQRDAAQRGEV